MDGRRDHTFRRGPLGFYRSQPPFDNARKIRELVAELHEHTLQVIETSAQK